MREYQPPTDHDLPQTTKPQTATGDTSDSRPPRFYRLGLAYGRIIYRLRWVSVVFWIIVLAASVPFASRVSSVLNGGDYSYGSSESSHVDDLLVQKLHNPPSQVFVVFHSSSVPVSDSAYQIEIKRFSQQAQHFADVTGVIQGGIGPDGRTTFLTVNFDKDANYMQQQLPRFRKLLPAGAAASPAQVYLTGDIAIYDEFNQLAQTDTEQADGVALPLALIALLIVFATVVAAILPLLLALVAVPVALALIYAIALHYSTSSQVLSVASVVGLGLSIDYSLLMTRRFREELSRGRSVVEAVSWTLITAGEAILFSGLIVIVGFCGLLLTDIPSLASFGIGGGVVVCAALLTALTLLPAIFSILGTRVNALRLPFLGRRLRAGEREGEQKGFWHSWAVAVMRKPVLITLITSVVLLLLGWPILSMKIGVPDVTSLPGNSEARQGFDILKAQFPALAQNPIYLVAQTPDGSSILTPDNLNRVNHLTAWVATQPHVTGVTSLTRLPAAPGTPALTAQQLSELYSSGSYLQIPALAQFVSASTSGDTTVITINSDTKLDSSQGDALINDLRAGDRAASQGLKVYVGGLQATTLDFNTYLYSSFPRIILFILIITYVLLLLMFRSVLLPLKAVVMNILSISVAYGVLVAVFQWGNLQSFFGFQSEGFVESTIPVVLFCVLFGLSMDYEVFLLSRIREEWLRTSNNSWSVARGLEKTGGVITNAALIFVIVAGAIAFTSLISTKEVGLGIAVAVLVDATIIRSLLVPATMELIGRWNWWLPGRALPVERPVKEEI
ncbi:MAG TPA: MMPL family transporter [Ktedonobacteraceae bacterium]|nr:MMPL family transporter [Ktedonobacteraceae bacterium]